MAGVWITRRPGDWGPFRTLPISWHEHGILNSWLWYCTLLQPANGLGIFIGCLRVRPTAHLMVSCLNEIKILIENLSVSVPGLVLWEVDAAAVRWQHQPINPPRPRAPRWYFLPLFNLYKGARTVFWISILIIIKLSNFQYSLLHFAALPRFAAAVQW